jgi:outer membrane receptor for ferrienterochelin and colicins
MQGNYRGKTTDYMGRTSMSDGTPGYGFVDAGLVYQLTPSARVKAGVYNLLDKEVTNDDYGVVLDGRRLNMGLTVDF